MNHAGRKIAGVLGGAPRLPSWHRNPCRKPGEPVGLHAWDKGDGFFSDFMVSMAGPRIPGSAALLEVKGRRQ